jgi:hypothetical protein
MKSLRVALTTTLCRPAAIAQTVEPIEAPFPTLAPSKGASEKLPVPAGPPWITHKEASWLTASPSYAYIIAYVEKLAISFARPVTHL